MVSAHAQIFTFFGLYCTYLTFLDFKEDLFLYTLEFSENVVNAIREAKESDPSASSLANLLANHNSGPYKQSKVLKFFPKGFNPNSVA